MKYLILVFLLTACTYKSDPSTKIVGSVRAIMMDHDTGPNINIMTLESLPHVYGLGAIEGLAGEITISDGKPLVSSIVDGKIRNTASFDVKATLFMYSQVEKFKTYDLEDGMDFSSLASYLGELTKELELTQPFVFRVEGMVDEAACHIINGTPGALEDHASSGFRYDINDREVELLGFYSEKHQGIITHHGSFTHIHMVDPSTGVTAHVENFTMGKNIKLYIPR